MGYARSLTFRTLHLNKAGGGSPWLFVNFMVFRSQKTMWGEKGWWYAFWKLQNNGDYRSMGLRPFDDYSKSFFTSNQDITLVPRQAFCFEWSTVSSYWISVKNQSSHLLKQRKPDMMIDATDTTAQSARKI